MGRRQALSEHPPAFIRSNGRSFRRSPPRRGTAVKPLRGVRKVSTTEHATYPGQDKNCCGRASGVRDLSTTLVSGKVLCRNREVLAMLSPGGISGRERFELRIAEFRALLALVPLGNNGGCIMAGSSSRSYSPILHNGR